LKILLFSWRYSQKKYVTKQFPDKNNQKLINLLISLPRNSKNLWVTIPWSWKYLGIGTWKLTRHFCLLSNFQVANLQKQKKNYNLWVTISEGWIFPDIVTRKFYIIPVLIFGSATISGCRYSEVEFFHTKNWKFKFCNGYTTFIKTEYLFKNQRWSFGTCTGLWVQAKKMGSSKDHFLISPQKQKYFKNIWGVRYCWFTKRPEFKNLKLVSL